MRRKGISTAGRVRLLVLMAGAVLLASCYHSSAYNELSLPSVTVTPATASVAATGTVQFTATVVSSINTTITWSVNNVPGGNATVGTFTVNGAISAAAGTTTVTGLYTAPANVPNPATVNIRATSSAETYPYGSANVTITAAPSGATVSLAPMNPATATGTSVQFTATVTGSSNTGVNWSVNGVAGGSSTVGTISSTGLYQAPASVPNPATVVVTATSQADSTQSASTTVALTASNSAPLTVDFGLNGNTGNPDTTYYNGLFTSVTVCLPATIQCETIPDVLVDTGSVGLRLLNSALTTIPGTEFGTIKDTSGDPVQECVQFGDTSYAWGPVMYTDVMLGGERASSVPFQVIGGASYYPVPASCLTLGTGPSLDTVQALGANGILGVGTYVQDCGPDCAAGQTFSGYPYYVCPSNVCQVVPVPVAQQVANPVAFLSQDNNGVAIVLPSIPASGAPSLPFANADGSGLIAAGQIIFGVSTESNNAIGSATIFALDANGNFPTIGFNGSTYSSEAFLDTGSNALYILDASTLGIANCTDNPFYCPSSPLALSLTPTGANGTTTTVNVSIANADSLFGADASFAAFNNLGGPSGTGLSTDYFDLGLPFFFGRTVFVGIAGTAAPNSVSAPNGYVAF